MIKFDAHLFGKYVRQERGSSGLREVAAILDISPSTLSRVERGGIQRIDHMVSGVTPPA